jgi:AcrR family transcriptional regulator
MPPRAAPLSPDDRRTAIVDAALPLLRERGAAVTTREVAQAAGIAEGTLFRAFGSKNELVGACCTTVYDPSRLLRTIAAIDPSLPLQARLVVAVEALQEHVAAVLGLMVALRATGAAAFPASVPRDWRGAGSAPPCPEAAQPPSPGPGPSGHPGAPRRPNDPRIDAALAGLIGEDAAALRLPVSDVVRALAHLTFSSAHPFHSITPLSASEIVSVVLDGTRKKAR